MENTDQKKSKLGIKKASWLANYKGALTIALSRELSDFEKNFTLIAGGIFAFTVTFIKDIIRIENSKCLIALIIAWTFLIVAIGIMMFTFLKSSAACDKLWKIIDDFLTENRLHDEEADMSEEQVIAVKEQADSCLHAEKRSLKRYRYSAVIFFIGGLSSLAIFVIINLSQNNKQVVKQPDKQTINVDTLTVNFNTLTITKIDSNANNKATRH